MKMRILTLGLIFFLVFTCCESPVSPDIKEILAKPTANIILDGELRGGYFGNFEWGFFGYVRNIGNGTGYNCIVEIQCFSDSNKTTIIDVAKGYPSYFGNIIPGQMSYFEAIAFNALSNDDIQYTNIKITWLNR